MSRIVVLALALTAASACSKSPQAPHRTRSEELEDVFEAVFRYQFEHNGSSIKQNAETYYLSVKDKEISDGFLKRFAGHSPPAKKGPAPETRERGENRKTLMFRINSWKWISKTKIEVTGGYYHHGTSASGNRYTLAKQNGKWVVINVENLWVS